MVGKKRKVLEKIEKGIYDGVEIDIVTQYVKNSWAKKGDKIISVISYLDHVLHGPARTYYKDHYIIKDIITYNYGKPHGVERKYYFTGSIWMEKYYDRGVEIGVHKIYYHNGSLKRETPYSHGMIHGIKKTYWSNKNLLAETPYVYSKMHGTLREYSKNGILVFEAHYIEGIKHGVQTEYYENGLLWRKTPYIEGFKEGLQVEYGLNGKIMRETEISHINDRYVSREEIPLLTTIYKENGDILKVMIHSKDNIYKEFTPEYDEEEDRSISLDI